jgi:hypothetical protein
MAEDDDTTLDDLVATTKEARDRDGDGVSDVQERLDGTDPDDGSDRRTVDQRLRPGHDRDARGELDLVGLDRYTVFDPSSTLPAGQTVDGGLTGLTDLDGTALRTDPSRVGLPDLGAVPGSDPNALGDVQRDPREATAGSQPGTGGAMTVAGVAGGSGPAGFRDVQDEGPPPDVGASGSADPSQNMGLVAGEKEDAAFVDAVKATQTAAQALATRFAQVTTDAKASATAPTDAAAGATLLTSVDALAADQAALDKAAAAMKEAQAAMKAADAAAEKDGDEEEDDLSDPDAVTAAPTVAEIERAIVVAGGDIDVVEGDGGRVLVPGATDATPGRDPLVTDPGDGDGLDTITGGPILLPGTTVSHPIDPRDPILGGGDGGGGQPGLSSGWSAATATVADAPGAPEVGSGPGGGIQSTVATGDTVLGDGDGDPPDDLDLDLGEALSTATAPAAGRVGPAPDLAVDRFAVADVADDPLPALDLVATRLAADLDAAPVTAVDDTPLVALVDRGGADLLDGPFLDDGGLDDG